MGRGSVGHKLPRVTQKPREKGSWARDGEAYDERRPRTTTGKLAVAGGNKTSLVGKRRIRGSPGEARAPPRAHLRVGALLRVATAQYGARLILQLLVLLEHVDQRHHGLQLRLPPSRALSARHPQLSPGPQLCAGGGGKSGHERRGRRRRALSAWSQSQRKEATGGGGATSNERKSLLSLLPPAAAAGWFPLPGGTSL